jgi:ribosomal protein L11 methyltransferase
MLDIGTGSGILAVTALKLGAKNALGIDIDELAATVAMENAALNGVSGDFVARRGDLAEGLGGKFDLITANIVADVIIRLAPDVPRHLADGGLFVASGIIDTREDEVKASLQQNGLNVFETKYERGWVSMACRLQKYYSVKTSDK